MPDPDYDALHDALSLLRDRVPRLIETLACPSPIDLAAWTQVLDGRILPRLSADFPVMAAICGGGSSGKSTLFNGLLGEAVSTVGGRAGLNRRVLAAVHPAQLARSTFLTELFGPFGTEPMALSDSSELTTPGPPVYVASEALPESVILMDTPDFDVGAEGRYLNRDVAAPVLTAADVLVYIFTNATYNARANIEFIGEQLTRIGRRPSVLVYRVYASFSEAEVIDHAETVARNLYGDDWREHVLAVYRADDSNAVASGEEPMRLRPVRAQTDLLPLLGGLDPRGLRAGQNRRMARDVTLQASQVLARARLAGEELTLYRDALRLVQSHAVAAGLAHLPLDRVLERIRVIFERTDPGFVRFSRQTGRITGAPLRGLLWLMGRRSDGEARGQRPDPLALTRAALVEAANRLRRSALAEELTATTTPTDADGAELIRRIARIREARRLTGPERPYAESAGPAGTVNVFVPAPPAVRPAQGALVRRAWQSDLEAIEEAAERVVDLPESLDAELEAIVTEFRRDLSFFKRVRAGLVASLNVIPPVLGMAYVFATYDPVGATTLAGKLSGLFGVNDLWATASIPASTGLDEATRRDLKRLLDPVVQRWFASRAAPVGALLQQHVTGTVLEALGEVLDRAERWATEVGAALERFDLEAA